MDNLKVHINSNLIKSTSTVPDELKDLGVSVYNENEFEQGVLLQVDLQLAEYELNQVKNRMEKIGVYENDDKSKKSDLSNKDEIKSLKKRKNDKYLNAIEEYKEKKLKLESKVDDYHNYLQNIDDKSKSASDCVVLNDNDSLIKTGEMTPFGTRICFETDFNKPTTSAVALNKNVIKTSNKQMKLTDFENFLVGSEKKSCEKKVNEKEKLVRRQSSIKKEAVKTEPTNFDEFLSVASEKNLQSKFSRMQNTSKSCEKPKTSNSSISIKKIIKKENVVTDFDKFLIESDSKATKEKGIGKLANKPVVAIKKIDKKKEEKKPIKEKCEKKRINIDIQPSDEVISFIKAIEEDDDENEVAKTPNMGNNFDSESASIISQVKRKIGASKSIYNDDNDSESMDLMSNENEDDDEFILDEDENNFDNDSFIEDSNDSEVVYDTDSSDGNNKKNLRKCNDDGDEDLFLKRLKKLDKIEKEARKNDNLSSEPEYVEFDNGFKVPSIIWNKLYKFQKTGVKWLWELHTQRCGGILGGEFN